MALSSLVSDLEAWDSGMKDTSWSTPPPQSRYRLRGPEVSWGILLIRRSAGLKHSF